MNIKERETNKNTHKDRFKEKTCGMRQALPMAGRLLNEPLGRTLGPSIPKGRRIYSGKLAGIRTTLAAVTH